MHDPERRAVCACTLVNVREGLTHFDRDGHGIRPADTRPHLHGAVPDVRERAPFDILHDRVWFAVVVGRSFENLRYARMVELRLDTRLVEKSRQKRSVVNVVTTHGLDDDRTFGAF